MQVRLLLGPAGSGKTFRCLAEARQELTARPTGPLLLFVAPKQTTFQLERQLLADRSLAGYTRLQILSFERLAYFLFDQCRKSPPDLLAEEGRVMVLRALLARKRDQLKVFRASARLTGFAQQLGELLGELQRNQFTPDALQELAGRVRSPEGLASKLQDLAGVLQDYLDWLAAHKLQDAERLLASAGELIRSGANPPPVIENLWVDGFAEWSPQELDLLALLLPGCREATFTFCLDRAPSERVSWLSAWSVVRKSFEECRKRLEKLPGISFSIEVLPRDPKNSRFPESAPLQYLERNWDEPSRRTLSAPLVPISPARKRRAKPASSLQLDFPGWQAWEQPPVAGLAAKGPSPPSDAPPPAAEVERALRVVRCADPEAEATLAAREILAHVRAGARYRDVTVLVRKLELYHDSVQRVFTRYQIPFFMDRRESVAHHPLAELTRSALRTLLTQWKHDEWFAALKTGLVPSQEHEIDELENEALARGWSGKDWHQPLRIPQTPGSRETESLGQLEERLEALRKRLLPPFQKLALAIATVHHHPTGSQLADAIAELWRALEVERQLEQWTEFDARARQSGIANSVHLTVWQQMNDWLENVRLAFPEESLSLREWLPVLEAGLASLTVGAIPPALDQVLIGSIERSRNPDIKLVIVLGLNETVFPAAPEPLPLLTDADRTELEKNDLLLASSPRRCLSRERFYAYIAFTRARQRIVLTSALYDAGGTPLNPSPFLARIRELFPALEFEAQPRAADWRLSEHASELIAPLLALQRRTPAFPGPADPALRDWQQLSGLPELNPVLNRLQRVPGSQNPETLGPDLARALYGPVLRTSVSRLEEYAACPFKFFVNSGLRAEERKRFELDAREQGSFQHEVLAEFHRQLRHEQKRWRDITPQQARERVGAIAKLLMAGYRDGLLQATEESRFLARVLTDSLKDFVETLVGWMDGQYQFDPVEVEIPFGYSNPAPAWQLDLGEGFALAVYGRIDRIDLWRRKERADALCLVVDYKSRVKQLDPVLVANGLQLQLLTYLNVLRNWPNPSDVFQVERLIPAGVFYVNLRGRYERSQNRIEALSTIEADRKQAYKHSGRFDIGALPILDARPGAREGDQFNYRLTNAGVPYKSSKEAMSGQDFAALLDLVESHLKRMGREILSGLATVDPYRKGGHTACDLCTYQAICRVDPWTQTFRVLKKPKDEAD